jgi:mannose/fructose-specific phosphotransferase system component IIA
MEVIHILKIFIASHGRLASGMKSSLNILLGSSGNVTAYDAYVDSTDLKDALNTFYNQINEGDQVLLLSDLYGGSVNQVMYTYLERPNTRLVAGINLAFLLEVACKDNLSDDKLKKIVDASGSALKQVTLPDKPSSTDTEESFF